MPTAIDANEHCTNENTFLLNQSFHPWSRDGRQLKLQMNVPLAYSVFVLDVCACRWEACELIFTTHQNK